LLSPPPPPCFAECVVDISDKQFTNVKDNSDILSPVSLLPMINYRQCHCICD
jgi:hypothetical protein